LVFVLLLRQKPHPPSPPRILQKGAGFPRTSEYSVEYSSHAMLYYYSCKAWSAVGVGGPPHDGTPTSGRGRFRDQRRPRIPTTPFFRIECGVLGPADEKQLLELEYFEYSRLGFFTFHKQIRK
jgi:hypothetical protein